MKHKRKDYLASVTDLATFRSMETIDYISDWGSRKADTMKGTNAPEMFWGNGGNDKLPGQGNTDNLIGGRGNDWLNGGKDDDVLEGDKGNDTFVFTGGYDKAFADDMRAGANFVDAGRETFIIKGSGNIFGYTDYDVFIFNGETFEANDLKALVVEDTPDGDILAFTDGNVMHRIRLVDIDL